MCKEILILFCLAFVLTPCCKNDQTDSQAGEQIVDDTGTMSGAVSSRSAPTAPTDLVVSAKTDSSITIGWSDGATNELFYEVERCHGANCTDFAAVSRSPLAANATGMTESGLTADSVYRFRVRATNGNGSSAWLTSNDVWTLLKANTAFTVTSISGNSISFSWTLGATDYTNIEIDRCAGATCTDFKAVFASPLAGNVTSFTEGGLSPATAYRFRLRGYSEVTTSDWLTSDPITTQSAVADPTSFSLTSLSDTGISFSWQDNSASELIYEVERCSGNGCSSFAAAPGSPLAANTTSYSGTGLTPSSYYTYRVRATGGTGSSNWLTGAQVKTAPQAPTGFTKGTVTSASVQFTWTDNASDETGYEIQKCSGSGCSNFSATALSPIAANSVTYTESSLSGLTTYRFRIRAVRTGVGSSWLTSDDITTNPGAEVCTSPKTYVVDAGQKGNVTAVGRGLWSDLKVIPGTDDPAIAYYDGSATGGTANIKLAYWAGTRFLIESVAGDMLVAAGSATFVRLAFLSSGKPMVFWTTGGTTVKGAMRSAALGSSGTWSAAVIDTVAGAASRALEVSVSPLDQVGLVYLTNTLNTGRARFIYCPAGCSSLASFVPMTTAGDTIEATNIIAAFMGTGVGWCKHDASTYYPLVTYPGNAGANIRYASCLGALSTCTTAAGWSGQYTNVVATAGVISKLLVDSTTVGDKPKILTRNAGNTLLQVFEMGQACNTAPAYTFNAGNTLGAATSGSAWATFMRSSSGIYHVIANLGTTNVAYYNSVGIALTTTAWNAIGTVDTLTLPAAGLGGGGADISNSAVQIYASYGGAAAPFNLMMGVVNSFSAASSSASAVYYSMAPDLTGGINLELAAGQARNISAASTAAGKPGIAYVDYSTGAVAGSRLKFAFRDGLTAETTWRYYFIPNTSSPMFPSLAFDHNDMPWISYYDGGTFRYYLVTNSAPDGSGDWTFYQFPINGKTATAAAPATDDTAMAMYYSSGVAKPLMVVMNSTAAGGTGVRAATFDPSTETFTAVATVDSLGGSYGTRLSADFDKNGVTVVAFYDLTTTKTKFNYSSNGTTWLGTSAQVSSATTGREGVSVRINPSNSRPAISYYDRANNTVYYSYCTTSIVGCAIDTNWTPLTVASSAGVSGIATANEQVLSTSLTFSADGVPYIAYMAGAGAATPILGLADNGGGSFATTTLRSAASANVTGAAALNFALTGQSVSSVRNALGDFIASYVGPNNWLYVTSCGD